MLINVMEMLWKCHDNIEEISYYSSIFVLHNPDIFYVPIRDHQKSIQILSSTQRDLNSQRVTKLLINKKLSFIS